ncbi:helix-turn-helix transcriptional regulator [Cellvibrio fibrivorans]|uniref:Transcriptional regulator with XRE-family HTH domain n=1 Tax=Cellvibrio fibrivorans TaxID=126350 RepID=A0ABU1UTQ3_9GAMM|nr:helix-turn-helix transcriptional regulator [Cellvibrio fibrivorans]MDR7088553.1 transcriptional regulator with XRE-family HTH domain [Cellvibrio fibrivorans]
MYRPKLDICRDLNLWMEKSGNSQEFVAKKLNISQPHLSRLLSHEYEPYTNSFLDLCIHASVDAYDRNKYDPLEDDELKKTIRLFVGNSPIKAGLVTNLVKALGDAPWVSH